MHGSFKKHCQQDVSLCLFNCKCQQDVNLCLFNCKQTKKKFINIKKIKAILWKTSNTH